MYFFLDKKVPKSQDYACFAQKTSARLAKSFKLAATQLKQERFLTPISLVFWLTSRGRSSPYNLLHAPSSPSSEGLGEASSVSLSTKLLLNKNYQNEEN
jgi:hypothetical protein